MSFSATDLERALCERFYGWWHWGKALGVEREPKTTSLSLGIELHGISEVYLKSGVRPDRLTQAGSMFIAGLPYLPPPKAGGVEGEFILSVSGHDYGGKLDYMGPLYNVTNDHKYVQIGHGLLDHKSSKNPKAYMLRGKRNETIERPKKRGTGTTRDEFKGFLDNIQAVIYAAQYLVRTNSDKVMLRWLYYKSVGAPEAVPSDIVLTRGEIEEAFGRLVHPLAERATRLWSDKSHPLTLAPNTERCHVYNRDCHYKSQCNLSLADHLSRTQPKKEPIVMAESMLEKARARKLAMQNGAGTPAPANVVTGQAGGPAPVAAVAAPVAAKVDVINPPEAAKVAAEPSKLVKTIEVATSSCEKADVAFKSSAVNVLVADRTLAVICGHLGAALTAIAADLRK